MIEGNIQPWPSAGTFRAWFRGFVFLLVAGSPLASLAQNYTHYWSNQYGRQGIFLSGAVVAGPEDNTAAIYNPAALGFTKGEGLALSFLSGGIGRLNIQNAVGEGLDIKTTNLFVLPRFLAYDLPIPKNERSHLVFLLYHEENPTIHQTFKEVFESSMNPDQLTFNNFDYNQRITEVNTGLAYAYRLNPHFSLGLSLTFPFRSHQSQVSARAEYLERADPSNLLQLNEILFRYNYSLISVRAKLAAAYRPPSLPNLKLGLTLTPPSFFSMFGSGDYEYRATIAVTDRMNTGVAEVLQNKNVDAKPSYKYPLSIAVGAQYDLERLSFFFSAEHFFGIDTYAVMTDNEDLFEGLTPTSPNQIRPLWSKADPVSNVALGLSYLMKEGVTLLAGFQTDFNSYGEPIPDRVIQLFATGWNQYHLSLGTSTLLRRNEVSIGLRYSFSFDNNVHRLGDISQEDPSIFDLLDPSQGADVRYNAISIAITYNFFQELF